MNKCLLCDTSDMWLAPKSYCDFCKENLEEAKRILPLIKAGTYTGPTIDIISTSEKYKRKGPQPKFNLAHGSTSTVPTRKAG